MAKPRRKSIKEKLDETEKELEKLREQYSEEIKGKTHNIFVKNKSIEEIQSKYNYSTKQNAQNQKYKCVEQIRKIKKENI